MSKQPPQRSTDPINPLGASVIMPWTPSDWPTLPSNATISTTPDTTRLEKAIADLGCKLDRLTAAVETMIAGLKVREAAEEMLRQVGKRRRRK